MVSNRIMVNVLSVWRDGTAGELFSARFLAFRAYTPVLTSWAEVITSLDTSKPLTIKPSGDPALRMAFDRAAGRWQAIDLYRAAIAADDAYSVAVTAAGAPDRWSQTPAQHSATRDAYNVKVAADKAYSDFCQNR